MEPSRHSDHQVINLGKKLIAQLGGDRAPDMLTQWMIHHIADLITQAETAQGDDAQKARQACMEAILLLWKHRNSMANGSRPFEEIESAVAVLAAIHPDKAQPFYFTKVLRNISSAQGAKNHAVDWSTAILALDDAAKLLIRYCLAQIINVATDDGLGEWLKMAQDIGAPEVDLDVEFVESLQATSHEFDLERLNTDQTDALRLQAKLAAFVEMAELIKVHLDVAANQSAL